MGKQIISNKLYSSVVKYELGDENFLIEVVNYMLREYDADYHSVKKKPIINGIDWFLYYWDTDESKKEFLKWLKNFLKKEVNCKHYKIEKIINVIDFSYGLKIYKS